MTNKTQNNHCAGKVHPSVACNRITQPSSCWKGPVITAMNVVKSSRSSSSQLLKAGGGAPSNHNERSTDNIINLYQEIPNVEVSLDDFEEFALERLKVRVVWAFGGSSAQGKIGIRSEGDCSGPSSQRQAASSAH
jgi:hypothetical protein